MNGHSNDASSFLIRFEQSVSGLEHRIRALEDRLARAETNATNKEEKCREHAKQLSELYEARNAVNLRLVPIEQMLKEEWKTGNLLVRLMTAESKLMELEKKADGTAQSASGIEKLKSSVDEIQSEKKENKEHVFGYKMMIFTSLFGIICSVLTALATYYVIGK